MDTVANTSAVLSDRQASQGMHEPADGAWTVARFHAGSVELTLDQERKLALWIQARLQDTRRFRLVLGGGTNTARSGRLRRLHALTQLLKGLGVAASRIIPDPAWFKPERMGALEDVPDDTMWLHFTHQSPAH